MLDARGRGERPARPTSSRRWWRPARWAWASTSPTSDSSCTWARRSRRSPTTSRSAGPGGACDRAEVILLPGREDATSGPTSRSLAFPPEHVVRSHARRAGRGGPAAVRRRAGDPGRPEPRPAGDDAQGPGRGRRGPPGQRRLGGDRPGLGLRRRAVRAGRGRASREQQAMLGYLATGGCRMEYLRRELDDPAAAPCGRCDNCTGRPWPAAVSEAGAAAARDRLLRPGRRGRAAEDVADRDEGAGRRRGRARSAPTGRGARPGPRPAHRPRLGPPAARPAEAGRPIAGQRRRPGSDGPSPDDWSPRPGQGAGRVGLGAAAGRRGHAAVPPPPAAHREPGPADRGDRPDAVPRRAHLRRTPAARPRRPASPAPASTAPSGCAALWHELALPASAGAAPSQGSAARCCSSTTGSTPAGR